MHFFLQPFIIFFERSEKNPLKHYVGIFEHTIELYFSIFCRSLCGAPFRIHFIEDDTTDVLSSSDVSISPGTLCIFRLFTNYL